jgi:cell division protein FtsW
MKIRLDYFLFFIIVLMLLLGISFLAVLSAPTSLKLNGTTDYFFIHQLLYGFLPGIILGLFAFFIPLDYLKKISPVLVLANLFVLSFTILPHLGMHIFGASRWLNLGLVNLQPSEFLKVTSILYLSSLFKNKLSSEHAKKTNFRDRNSYLLKEVFFPFIIYLFVIAIIFVLQPNVSTLVIIGLIALVIYFSAGTPIWHSLVIVAGAFSALVLLIKYESYRLARLLVFLNPDADPMGKGFQIKQSLIAIGSGGWAGRGFGMSSQIGFLPQTLSDATFAVFAEETGFIGCLLLILLFGLILWVGMAIARRSDDKFSKLVATGITFWILFQGFVNISAMTGIMPLTGVPLPFISYGGSHIVTELIAMGLLLNIANKIKT